MSIQAFGFNFDVQRTLVDKSGVPTRDGRDFLLSLFNRTGAGTGIVPKMGLSATNNPLVATGSVLADSLQLTADWNLVGTVGAGTGVQILPLKPGNDIQVYNAGANNLNVYPPGGSQIDALAINQAFVLAPNKLRIFECWTLTQLYSFGN